MNAELMRLISNIIRTGVIFDVNPQTQEVGCAVADWRQAGFAGAPRGRARSVSGCRQPPVNRWRSSVSVVIPKPR